MKRQAITDGSGKWFNVESAELIKEETFWNGQNCISKATGSQWNHEALYRTKGKVWILNKYSDYQGSRESFEIVEDYEAAIWLSKNGLEPHNDCKKEFAELEIL